MTVDLIINPRARHFDGRRELVEALRDIAQGHARSHVTENEDELRFAAGRIAAEGSDLVLLAGGDGSLMAGVTALHEAFDAVSRPLPAISPIPAGTAGTIARNWGIAGRPHACLRRLFERPRRLVPRPSLRAVAAEQSTVTTRIGFIVGTGLVARFFRIYYARGAPGYQGSAKLVARIFVESFVGGPLAREVLEPLPCHLEVDGASRAPTAWSLVCCSVIRDLGIHMLVNYRAEEDFDRPHLVATPMTPRHLGPRAPFVLAGQSIGGPELVDQLTSRFKVTFPDGAPGPYVLDGELLSASELTVSSGPVLTIATPT